MEDGFWWIVAAGFFAQLVDGALGMAYGLTATCLLLGMGFTPASASAAVHLAETATTGFSGASHHFARNVDWRLARRLAAAGVLGGVAGALLLASGLGEWLRPFVSVYLAVMGGVIVVKAFRPARPPEAFRRIWPLGLSGGFLDALGGGGWGPIVSGTLVMSGREPRMMIGSSVAAEFFVTIAVTIAFIGGIGLEAFGWAALGLVLGGLPAAPLGAVLARVLPRRPMMIAVGALVSGLGAWGAFSALRILF